jgi:hypothetical protein
MDLLAAQEDAGHVKKVLGGRILLSSALNGTDGLCETQRGCAPFRTMMGPQDAAKQSMVLHGCII